MITPEEARLMRKIKIDKEANLVKEYINKELTKISDLSNYQQQTQIE